MKELNEILKEIKSMVGDASVECNEVIKNNNVKLHGVMIRYPNQVIVPTIYVENFLNKDMTPREIAKEIISTSKSAQENPFPFNPDDIAYYDKMSDKICLRLIGQKGNEKLLESLSWKPFYDLAQILVAELGNGMSIKITKDLLEKWEVDTDEVFKLAKENSQKKFPAEIKDMREVMAGVFNLSLEEFIEMTGDNMPSQYVLTNKEGVNGATCLVYDNVLEIAANIINDDFAILPSSIHEVILQPILPGIDLETLSKTVREVNMEEVPKEDILSDHAYIYRRKTGLLEY